MIGAGAVEAAGLVEVVVGAVVVAAGAAAGLQAAAMMERDISPLSVSQRDFLRILFASLLVRFYLEQPPFFYLAVKAI